MWIWPIQCICFKNSCSHHSNTWSHQLLMYLSLDTRCVVEIYYQDSTIQPTNVKLFSDKSRTQHNTLVSEMKLWRSRRDKRLNCYRIINKITQTFETMCFLINTFCCWMCGEWPWLAAKHPSSCSLSPPQEGWGNKIGRRGARKLVCLNKTTDSGMEKQRWQTFKHLGKAPFLSLS